MSVTALAAMSQGIAWETPTTPSRTVLPRTSLLMATAALLLAGNILFACGSNDGLTTSGSDTDTTTSSSSSDSSSSDSGGGE